MTNVITDYQRQVIEMARQIYETHKMMGVPITIDESLKQAEEKLFIPEGE